MNIEIIILVCLTASCLSLPISDAMINLSKKEYALFASRIFIMIFIVLSVYTIYNQKHYIMNLEAELLAPITFM